jgi:hypothetical protein
MAGCHLHERRYSGTVWLPVIWQLQARGRIASAVSEQRLAVVDGDTRAPARLSFPGEGCPFQMQVAHEMASFG